MDKKSKILIILFILIILGSIFLTYKRALVEKNFIIFKSEEVEE